MNLRDFTKCETFSGISVVEGGFIVRFDGVNYLITENESDGYRSYLNDVETTNDKCDTFDEISIICTFIDDGFCETVSVYDSANNLEILKFGTGNYDDYYPYCVLNYTPENMSANI